MIEDILSEEEKKAKMGNMFIYDKLLFDSFNQALDVDRKFEVLPWERDFKMHRGATITQKEFK